MDASVEPVPTYRRLLFFFLPLFASALMLGLAGNLMNAGLARLSNATIVLASVSVARSLMQLVISPMHMIRPTVSSLASNGSHLRIVRRFALFLTGSVSLLLVLLAFSPLASFVFLRLIGVDDDTGRGAVVVLRLLCLYPLGLFFKDFYHGLAIRLERTYLSALGTLVRIGYLALFLAFVTSLDRISGFVVAGSILTIAPFVEGLSLLAFVVVFSGRPARALDRRAMVEDAETSNSVSIRGILSFYRPLALTSILSTLTSPLLNMAIARFSHDPAILAGFAVGWSVTMTLVFPLRLFHQVSIRFSGTPAQRRRVRFFGGSLGVLASLLLFLVGFSDLGFLILQEWIGVDHELALLAIRIPRILWVVPLLTVLRQDLWGILMRRRTTRGVSAGKIVALPVLILALMVLNSLSPGHAGVNAAGALLAAECVETLVVWLFYRKSSAYMESAKGAKHVVEL